MSEHSATAGTPSRAAAAIELWGTSASSRSGSSAASRSASRATTAGKSACSS
ncbi:hypothetical protein [Rhodovibrio sodomensis]|uniref:hypothetical protein n=1 Tax=Rhodovibrio sodomensis TaxID=1088 RepID=UPI0019052D90|nr:hypothetical protein [Rhodovibrio sodomensis]